MGPLGPIPRTLAQSSCLPREVQSYESRRRWNTTEIEAFLEDKGTVNTLCGRKLLDYAASREDASHCEICRRIAAEMLTEAVLAERGMMPCPGRRVVSGGSVSSSSVGISAPPRTLPDKIPPATRNEIGGNDGRTG